EEHHVALGQQALLELRAKLLADIIHLLKRAEGHRHALQRGDRRLDFGKSHRCEQTRVEIARLHQSDHVRLTALCAVGKNGELHRAIRGLAPFFAHRQQALVIRGAARRECSKADVERLVGGRRGRREPQEDSQRQQPGRRETVEFFSHAIHCAYSFLSDIRNKSSVRDNNQRARRFITRLTRRHSGLASALTARARLSSSLNSATFCFCTETDSASDTNGPASCPPDNSKARAKCFLARSSGRPAVPWRLIS